MKPAGDEKWLKTICFALFALTLALYLPTIHHGFIVYDDPDYITQNHWVKSGLTRESFAWAFNSVQVHNWHPITWLSHMLDVELFGLNPGGHHLVNAIFHSVNSALLFYVLWRMTGARWRSAIVAALFAWHPLHVESVAWVSERKDVLSTFFWLLTIWAYSVYVRQRARSEVSKSAVGIWYFLALLFFIMGLMSKPMVVTLPFILLLLDYWPLSRLSEKTVGLAAWARQSRPLIMEKIPFVLLSGAACAVTILAQTRALKTVEQFPFVGRLENAVISYGAYLWNTFAPTHLAVFYPYPKTWPMWQTAISLLALLAISILVIKYRNHRFLLVGWLWYLVTLVPVIGLVQVGSQARADRYTYIPLTGLFVMAVWGIAALTRKNHRTEKLLAGCATVTLAAFAFCSSRQITHWKNNETLFGHAAAVTSNNVLAYFNLGISLFQQDRNKEALAWFEKVLAHAPHEPDANHFVGQILCRQGDVERASHHLMTAELVYARRLSASPDNLETVKSLAFTKTSLGLAMVLQKNQAGAIPQFREALKLEPNQTLAGNELAWILATAADPALRNGAEAVRLAEKACASTGWKRLEFIGTLDAAYAEAGRFEEAIATAEKLITAAAKEGQSHLLELAQNRLALYRSGKAFHQ